MIGPINKRKKKQRNKINIEIYGKRHWIQIQYQSGGPNATN